MELKFKKFLEEMEKASYPTNTTATGTLTIQQTLRNELRRQGVKALKEDLDNLYGEWFEVYETKEGVVFTVDNKEGFTISWELKNSIKALDYDAFEEADRWALEEASREAKKAKREEEARQREEELIRKRQEYLESR